MTGCTSSPCEGASGELVCWSYEIPPVTDDWLRRKMVRALSLLSPHCRGKKRLKKSAVGTLGSLYGAVLDEYRCQVCGGRHLGNRPDPQRLCELRAAAQWARAYFRPGGLSTLGREWRSGEKVPLERCLELLRSGFDLRKAHRAYGERILRRYARVTTGGGALIRCDEARQSAIFATVGAAESCAADLVGEFGDGWVYPVVACPASKHGHVHLVRTEAVDGGRSGGDRAAIGWRRLLLARRSGNPPGVSSG